MAAPRSPRHHSTACSSSYLCSLEHRPRLTDPAAAAKHAAALDSSLARGHGYAEAAQLATGELYSTLQQQSLLLALKDILGWLFVRAAPLAIISRGSSWFQTIYRVRYAKAGDDMV